MKLITVKDTYFLAVITLMKLVRWSSSARLKELVLKYLAFAAYGWKRDKRQLIESNLAKVFGRTLSERERREIVKGVFYEFWRDVFSLLPTRTERASLKRIELRGVEHLHRALKVGKGLIVWESRFFGRRALAKQILHENGFSIHQVHAENHIGGFDHDGASASWVRYYIIKRFFDKGQKPFVAEVIYLPSSDSLAFTRIILSRLKHNATVCIAGDGRRGQKRIPVKFLGRTELFSTGMVSLAKISGASVLPMFCIQERDGQIRLIIERPIQIETGMERERGLENSLTQYVSVLEAYIRRYPEQYRNWHSLGQSMGAEPSIVA